MTMDKFILINKEPVIEPDLVKWGKFMEDFNNRRVAVYDQGMVHVSTVFLGIDHGFFDGPPVLFETMIFRGNHDGYQERYATWDEAERGHEVAVNLVKDVIT